MTNLVLKAVTIGVLVLACVRGASAQTVDAEASVMTHELMSPFCPGLLLADCRSDGARELRAEITRRLEAGQAANVIEDDLAARFGPAIRAVPEFRGVGTLVWLGPPVFAIAAFAFLVVVVRAATRRSAPRGSGDDPSAATEDPAALERIQEELDALD